MDRYPSLTLTLLFLAFLTSSAGLLVLSLRPKKSRPTLLPWLLLAPFTLGYTALPVVTAPIVYLLFGWWLGEPLTGFLWLATLAVTALVPIGYAVFRKQWQMVIVTAAACLFAYLIWSTFIGGMDSDVGD